MENKYGQLEVKDTVGIIWLDMEGSAQNTISAEMMDYVEPFLKEVTGNDAIKAAVLISRKKDFIAGADIKFFDTVKPGEWMEIGRNGHGILDVISSSAKPVIAAINGACLGAGLEIALACHGRICTNAKHTKMALPEVQLGILPGGGGTQRLPQLVGLQVALDMMLTGKNIYPQKAKKTGLVDAVVNPYGLLRAATEAAKNYRNKTYKEPKSLKDNLLENNPLGRKIVFDQAEKKVLALTKGNYPAPERILECVKAGFESRQKGFEAELKYFDELLQTPVSKQLRNIFFNITEKKKNPYKKEAIKAVKTLAIIGAGFMGAGVAEISSAKNIDVILKDIDFKTTSSAKAQIWGNLMKKVKRKSMTRFEADLQMNKVVSQVDYKNFDTADLVIEAVFEDLNLKQKILEDCEQHSKTDTIFASNTSALSIDKIAAKAARPELVIGMHYFSPVPKMPLLEIVKGTKTADWVVATCLQLGIQQGKTCIVVNDGPGFYTTRILAPMLNEALLLLDEGVDITKVDEMMKEVGYPVGPYNLIDEVGIDVGAHIMEGELMDRFLERPGAVASQSLKAMFEAGYQGRKNKVGFYKYDAKTGKRSKNKVNTDAYKFFKRNASQNELETNYIKDRILLAMVNEAAHCLDDKIINNPKDGDIGAIFGLGFPPFTGGPFQYIDTVGASKIIDRLNQLKSKCGNRYEPASCIVEMATVNKKFYDMV